jgi:hypothetical protein
VSGRQRQQTHHRLLAAAMRVLCKDAEICIHTVIRLVSGVDVQGTVWWRLHRTMDSAISHKTLGNAVIKTHHFSVTDAAPIVEIQQIKKDTSMFKSL